VDLPVGEMVAEDDLVAFEATMTGTHEGAFGEIDPTHTSVEVRGNAMHRIRDARIAETWATWDFLGALQQPGTADETSE
jgi:predicted ester cyclase